MDQSLNNSGSLPAGKKTAVLIPCRNEEQTIAGVVRDFKRELPKAEIYVYDNASTDNTAKTAEAAGAVVRYEKRKGKGFVVARMFSEVDADLYILVDGDNTYGAKDVHKLIEPIANNRADMTVGNRLRSHGESAFPRFHFFGNRLVASSVNLIFDASLNDIMSGYRAFNREFVKSMPLVARGFEIETLMTLLGLYYGFVIEEVEISYRERPEGSLSKLSTFRDGFLVLLTIFNAFKANRPLLFFSIFGALSFILGTAVIIYSYLGVLPLEWDFPLIMAGFLLIFFAVVFIICGVIIDTVNYRIRELSHLIVHNRQSSI